MVVKKIVVLGTNISTYRLSEDARVFLRGIIKQCLDALDNGNTIVNLLYDSVYLVDIHEVWITNCKYKPLDDDDESDFIDYTTKLGDLITRFVLNDQGMNHMPPDVGHLINYLKTTTTQETFNPEVLSYHTSLSIHGKLTPWAHYLYDEMKQDVDARGQNVQGAELLANFQCQLQPPFTHRQDKNDHFWRRARKNVGIANGHDLICAIPLIVQLPIPPLVSLFSCDT